MYNVLRRYVHRPSRDSNFNCRLKKFKISIQTMTSSPWFVQISTIAKSIQLQDIQDSKTIFIKLSKSGHDYLQKIGQLSAPDETKTSWTDQTYLETTWHFTNTRCPTSYSESEVKPRNSEKGCKSLQLSLEDHSNSPPELYNEELRHRNDGGQNHPSMTPPDFTQ